MVETTNCLDGCCWPCDAGVFSSTAKSVSMAAAYWLGLAWPGRFDGAEEQEGANPRATEICLILSLRLAT